MTEDIMEILKFCLNPNFTGKEKKMNEEEGKRQTVFNQKPKENLEEETFETNDSTPSYIIGSNQI